MDIRHRIHPGLRGLVDRIQGYAYRLDPRAVHHGVPSPSATIIVSFDEPMDVTWLDDPAARVQRWLLASGMHTGPALIRTHGIQHGIQLDFTPAGCRALLGLPIGTLARCLADHADLPHGIPDDLHAQLADVDWPQRFQLLDTHLLRIAGRSRAQLPADLAYAWGRLGECHGRIRIAALADEIGWSRRHLVTRFASEFGLPPRDIGRLHRFGAAQEYAKTGAPWSEVAARFGYADQAHLSREFRSFTAQTPTQWRAEAFPILQDTAVANVANSSAVG